MGCNGDYGRSTRRRAVACLLIFAKELEKAGRISKASKGLLKELIVHENEHIMSIGDGLAGADGGQDPALDIIEEQIKKRASKSHQELFEICSLEQAHLLSQQDTEALTEDSDTKSLVYGEIDFWSFYDVVKLAAEGMNTNRHRPPHKTGKLTTPQPADLPTVSNDHPQKQLRQQQQQQHGSLESEEKAGTLSRQGQEQQEGQQHPDSRGENALDSSRIAIDDKSKSEPGVRMPRKVIEVGADAEEKAAGAAALHEKGSDRRRKGLKFYDLGSGSGKAVFAAVLAVDFRCAVGIEVLAGVHRASVRVLKRYRRLVEPVLCSPAVIKLRHGSFLEQGCDWSDGDLVFANSTCFAEDTLLAIAERATFLRPGARIVTFTTALKTPWLRVLWKKRYQMSWGPATVFVHQKLSSSEYAARLREGTPFDEDQGISRAGSTNGAVLAPSSSGGGAVGNGDIGASCVDNGSSSSSCCSSSSGSSRSGSCCGFGSGTRGANSGATAVDKEEQDGEEGEGQMCSSLPRRPLHC